MDAIVRFAGRAGEALLSHDDFFIVIHVIYAAFRDRQAAASQVHQGPHPTPSLRTSRGEGSSRLCRRQHAAESSVSRSAVVVWCMPTPDRRLVAVYEAFAPGNRSSSSRRACRRAAWRAVASSVSRHRGCLRSAPCCPTSLTAGLSLPSPRLPQVPPPLSPLSPAHCSALLVCLRDLGYGFHKFALLVKFLRLPPLAPESQQGLAVCTLLQCHLVRISIASRDDALGSAPVRDPARLAALSRRSYKRAAQARDFGGAVGVIEYFCPLRRQRRCCCSCGKGAGRKVFYPPTLPIWNAKVPLCKERVQYSVLQRCLRSERWSGVICAFDEYVIYVIYSCRTKSLVPLCEAAWTVQKSETLGEYTFNTVKDCLWSTCAG